MCVPEAVGMDSAFVFVSGEDGISAFERNLASDTVSKIGKPHYLASDPGTAAQYDLSLPAGMYGLFAGSFVATNLMQNGPSGAKIEQSVANFLISLIQSMSGYITNIAKAWDDADWSHHGHPLEMQKVAIGNVLQTCHYEGVDGSLLENFDQLVEQLIKSMMVMAESLSLVRC